MKWGEGPPQNSHRDLLRTNSFGFLAPILKKRVVLKMALRTFSGFACSSFLVARPSGWQEAERKLESEAPKDAEAQAPERAKV